MHSHKAKYENKIVYKKERIRGRFTCFGSKDKRARPYNVRRAPLVIVVNMFLTNVLRHLLM